MHEELKRRGGGLLAISVDTEENTRHLVESQQLTFPVLLDTDGRVIREYGLLHLGAGLTGEDVAAPAQLLVDSDRRIVWRHIANRVTDRADPRDVLLAIDARWPGR